MTIQRGDYVRPNNTSLGLPRASVWRVACSAGALKLEPANDNARCVNPRATVGCRFPAHYFDKVELCNGKWVEANDEDFLRATADSFLAFARGVTESRPSYNPPCNPISQSLPKTRVSAVAKAEANLANAANATAALAGLLEATRKLEAVHAFELQAAKVAKAKADKEAAAKAKAEEVKRQLSARLHADRCLGEATLALIAEVSRLNNGGSEHVAHSSIADHVDQLQPLAKSYGYRIAKPSMLAQVVKL